jgi:cytidylate kinase
MQGVRIITIAREYGSGGAAIGQKIANRLNWKFLDRELMLELARRADLEPSEILEMDERPNSLIARMMKAFWLGDLHAWTSPDVRIVDPDYVAEMTELVIGEAANLGHCVIVGRGAQCVLQGRNDAFHVFVYGSREEKLRRIQPRHSKPTDCESALDEIDRTRAAYIRQYYQRDWADPHLYDLMINSDLGLDLVASVILSTAELTAEEVPLIEFPVSIGC